MALTTLNQSQKQVLSILASDQNFSKNFYFTGGTALAEYYLKHRYSEDLDFFSQQEIDSLWVTILSKKIKKQLGADQIDIQQSFNRNLVFFILKKEILKTEFTYFPFSQIKKPSAVDRIKIDSLDDIAVNKFFTIYQTPSARHFIDLYLIIQQKKIGWKDLSRLARKKFDTNIDPIQLGSQLLTAQDVQDLPKMIIKISDKQWRNYFIEKAISLKEEIRR